MTKHAEALTRAGRSRCRGISERNGENKLHVGERVRKEPGMRSPGDRYSHMFRSVSSPS